MIPAVIIAALLILLAAAVAVAYKQADTIRIGKAHTVRLEEAVTNKHEGDNKRVWELRPDAVNPMVQRGRPDVSPTRQATTPPGEVVRVGEMDVWDGDGYVSERGEQP
jgi:hypothetical protein